MNPADEKRVGVTTIDVQIAEILARRMQQRSEVKQELAAIALQLDAIRRRLEDIAEKAGA